MTDAPVVVVGAGLAGLAAARRLRAAGVEVVVLEARGRVGGRTEGGWTQEGLALELGGQWIGASQTRMYELVAELDLETFPTWNEGHHLTSLRGRTSKLASHRGAVPHLGPFVLADLFNGLRKFDALAATIPLDAPWQAADARTLDGQTFETWILRNLRTDSGRNYFRIVTEALFAADSTDLSALHALFYSHSGTDLETLLSVDRGAQADRIVGGTIRISERMAEELGDCIHLDAPVVRIEQDPFGATVVTLEGEAVAASQVIVTLPPTLAGRIDHEPALPSWRDQLTQRVPAGSVIKFHAVYERPFWRDDGLTGQVVADVGPVKVTFDNSPPDGSRGVLMGFFEGNDGRRWARRSQEERRGAAIAGLARHFGPRAAKPIDYLERDWMAERYSRGCYGAHFAPGVWTAYGHALRTPVGRVRWAGAECAPVWNGYMEGAVRSGEQAAEDIISSRQRTERT